MKVLTKNSEAIGSILAKASGCFYTHLEQFLSLLMFSIKLLLKLFHCGCEGAEDFITFKIFIQLEVSNNFPYLDIERKK